MKYTFRYIISVLLFALAFWGITYTSDWVNYEYYFDHDLTMKSDLASFFIFDLVKNYGYDYQVAFRVHIALMSLLYPLIFSRMRQNPIPYTILLVIIFYVPIANQIRYFTALPFALLSVVCFSKHKITLALLCGILGFTFHSTMIIFYIVIGFYYFFVVRKGLFKRNVPYLIGGIIVALLFSTFISLTSKEYIDTYSKYSSDENLSSFIGGLFTMIPKLLSLSFVFIAHKIILRFTPGVIYNHKKDYYLMWIFSVATSFLIPLGFSIQIFVNRFVSPMLVFQIMYLAYVGKNRIVRKKVHTVSMIIIILIVTVLWQTIVPYLLGIKGTPIDTELVMILNSYQL